MCLAAGIALEPDLELETLFATRIVSVADTAESGWLMCTGVSLSIAEAMSEPTFRHLDKVLIGKVP